MQASGLGIWVLITFYVVWSIARLLDHGCLSKPLPLVKDGDLIAIVQRMILARTRTRLGSPW